MAYILIIVYILLGYWATGQTLFYNKIVIMHQPGELFMQRLVGGVLLGWLLIPVALILSLFRRR